METLNHQIKATMQRCWFCDCESEDTALICYGCGHKFSESKDVSLLRKVLKKFRRIIHGEWVGYVVAIPLSFIISVVTSSLLLLVFSGSQLHSVLLGGRDLCIDMSVGFSRVFFASWCFPQSKRLFKNRVFGSTILLSLWLAYESYLRIQHYPITVHECWPLSESVSMILEAIGGLAAVFLFYREQQKSSS